MSGKKLNLSPTITYCLINNLGFLIGGITALFFTNSIHIIFGVIGLVSISCYVYNFLYILNVKYIVTEEVLINKTGIISRKIDTVELFRVKDYQVTQSIVERMLRLMTITLYSRDINQPVLHLKGLAYDEQILHEIRNRVQIARQKNRIFEYN